MTDELKSITSSPHDAWSIVKMVEAISILKEMLRKLANRVETLEKESWSRSVALSNRDGTVKGNENRGKSEWQQKT